jgi:hypothetical protein
MTLEEPTPAYAGRVDKFGNLAADRRRGDAYNRVTRRLDLGIGNFFYGDLTLAFMDHCLHN